MAEKDAAEKRLEAYEDAPKGEIETMCDAMTWRENKGLERGVISSIANLMDSMRLTMEQAMEALKVPLDKRGVYAQMLKEYQG